MALTPREQRFKDAYDAVERRIEERYGIPVRIADVVDPNTGDFNGVEISLDHDQNLDMALFGLLHIFGHTVQWNRSRRKRDLGLAAVPMPAPEPLLRRIRAYERQASAYGLTLMHDAGVRDLDAWLADWSEADWRYLRHVYTTGEKRPFAEFLAAGAGRLRPLPIPPFTPRRWVSRYSF